MLVPLEDGAGQFRDIAGALAGKVQTLRSEPRHRIGIGRYRQGALPAIELEIAGQDQVVAPVREGAGLVHEIEEGAIGRDEIDPAPFDRLIGDRGPILKQKGVRL